MARKFAHTSTVATSAVRMPRLVTRKTDHTVYSVINPVVPAVVELVDGLVYDQLAEAMERQPKIYAVCILLDSKGNLLDNGYIMSLDKCQRVVESWLGRGPDAQVFVVRPHNTWCFRNGMYGRVDAWIQHKGSKYMPNPCKNS